MKKFLFKQNIIYIDAEKYLTNIQQNLIHIILIIEVKKMNLEN